MRLPWYLEVGDHYRMSLFHDLEGYEESLLPIEKSIYDQVITDSQVERDFAAALEKMDEVKLPDWFLVPTPVGDYVPDWAIVFNLQDDFGELREKLHLVREMKGTLDEDELRGMETMKIDCARRHFEAIEVRYDVATSAEDLRQQVLKKR